MFEEWTPVTLAKLSLLVMFIPAGLTVFAVITSILLSLFLEFTCIKKDSALGIQLDKAGGSIFYIAFLSVIVMNVTAVGLFISGGWAVLNYLASLVS